MFKKEPKNKYPQREMYTRPAGHPLMHHDIYTASNDRSFRILNEDKCKNGDFAGLQELDLSRGYLCNDSANLISEIIKSAPNLKKVSLNDNRFTTGGMRKILSALEDHHSLETLDIGRNQLAYITPDLTRLVKDSKSLKSLLADNIGLDDEGMAEVLGVASESKSIQHLSLTFNSPDKATSEATLTLLHKNPNITRLSLLSHGVRKGDAFFDTFSSVSHRNLLALSTTTDELEELTFANIRTAQKVMNMLSESMDGLDFQQLSLVTNRLPSAHYLLERENDDGISLSKAKRNFADVIAKMPPMPQKGSDINAFFEVNEHGYTALDNPVLWERPDAEERLAGFVIKREDLTRKTEKGASLLESLAHGMPAAKTVPFLNKQGIKLGARELLDSEGAPNAVYKAFIEKNDIAPLFSLENSLGKSRGELRALIEPLSSLQQKLVPFQSLTLGMRRSGSNQNMGR